MKSVFKNTYIYITYIYKNKLDARYGLEWVWNFVWMMQSHIHRHRTSTVALCRTLKSPCYAESAGPPSFPTFCHLRNPVAQHSSENEIIKGSDEPGVKHKASTGSCNKRLPKILQRSFLFCELWGSSAGFKTSSDSARWNFNILEDDLKTMRTRTE